MNKTHRATIASAIQLAILLLAALWTPSIHGATGTLTPSPYLTVFDSNGDPVSGACVWTYTAGTTTPIATYTDVNLSVANANPIIADSAGRFVAYLTQGQSYKFVFENACTPPAHGSTIKTSDNIAAVPGIAGGVDVLGTAGEALAAGNAVYLSDGSGSKTQGSWYKTDTGNGYSSTLPLVGMVPSSITSGAAGSVRIVGQVSGLSSLTVGADYYVSTSGAITATTPFMRRWVGRADSATTLVLAPNPPPLVPGASVDEFRLSLTTATCTTTADVTGASAVTLFFTPCTGNHITLADAAGTLQTVTTAELSIAVPGTTNTVYDVWVYNNAGTPALELLAWTNDTTRATGVAKTTTGFYTKSGDLTRRYVGSMRTTAVSGQTEDSLTSRYVWNFYNQKDRPLQRLETTASWTYASTTVRQANAAAANQVNVLMGVLDYQDPIDLTVSVSSTFATASQIPIAGVGLDSTTTMAGNQSFSSVFGVSGAGSAQNSHYNGFSGIGKHTYSWNEACTTTTCTFYSATSTVGGSTAGSNVVSGIIGKLKG